MDILGILLNLYRQSWNCTILHNSNPGPPTHPQTRSRQTKLIAPLPEFISRMQADFKIVEPDLARVIFMLTVRTKQRTKTAGQAVHSRSIKLTRWIFKPYSTVYCIGDFGLQESVRHFWNFSLKWRWRRKRISSWKAIRTIILEHPVKLIQQGNLCKAT